MVRVRMQSTSVHQTKSFEILKFRTMTSERAELGNSRARCEIVSAFDSKSIAVRVGTGRDFGGVAQLHVEGITEGFLSTLGLRFLSTLYAGIAQAPGSRVLVAEQGKAVLGFIAFTADVASCYRWVLTRRFLPLGFALLPKLLKLSIYRNIIETLLYPRRVGNDTGTKRVKQSAGSGELLAMAVSERSRGLGIGKVLVAAMNAELDRLGVSECRVVTHALDERSNGFYQRCGFCLVRSFQNHGKPMKEYLRMLSK